MFMKSLLKIVLLSFLITSVQAREVLGNLSNELNSYVQVDNSKMDLKMLKSLAEERNQVLDIAFENYIIAKRRVSVARAGLNPLTTGHVLGLALGLNYLWVPMAVNAVLSIPTHLYNISKNVSLRRAEYNNYTRALKVLNNEIAHLYFDIVTHEVILKTIDLEIEVYKAQLSSFETREEISQARKDEVTKTIIGLNIEKINIYNLFVEELAALRTMVSRDINDSKIELQQVANEINDRFIQNTDLERLENFARQNSDEVEMLENLYDASIKNVKAVKWSLITFEGLNFSYKRRVKIAKNEMEITRLERLATILKVKKTAISKLDSLQSSLDVFENYKSLSLGSQDFHDGLYINYTNGIASEDSIVLTAVSAIRDFRNKVVAHYNALSAFDDLKLAAGYNFVFDPSGDNTIQTQMESK